MRDRVWIRLMVSGDRYAGEQFVQTYYARIERLLRCLTGSPDTARDLTQQTFVKAWQALPAFKFEASLQTWLHRIAYHEYTHWLRDRRDHAPIEAAHHIADTSANAVVNDWGIVLLPDALAQLSEELRDTFLLFYVQELSVKEVADVLNVPRGTVKSRLFTARQQLRGLLEREMRDTTATPKSEYRLEATQTPTQAVTNQRNAIEIPAVYRVEPEPTAVLPLAQNTNQILNQENGPHSREPLKQQAQQRIALPITQQNSTHHTATQSASGGDTRGSGRYALGLCARLMGRAKGEQG